MKRRGRYRRLTRTHCGRTKTSREEFSTRQRTSQEEGLAPARPNPRNGGGKPLFLTCSILFSPNSMKFLFLCLFAAKNLWNYTSRNGHTVCHPAQCCTAFHPGRNRRAQTLSLLQPRTAPYSDATVNAGVERFLPSFQSEPTGSATN